MVERRLSHAYMIIGPEGAARDEKAKLLAAALLCEAANPPCGVCRNCRKVLSGTHPDVIVISRQSGEKGLHREILVDQIRAAAADAAIAPNEAGRKAYIITQADRMNAQAQNALLKVLEDPPGSACFILCAAAADAMLPTVRSRCVRVSSERDDAFGCAPISDAANGYLEAAAAGDMAGVVLFAMQRTKMSPEETDAFADDVQTVVCDILCGRRPNPGLSQRVLFHISDLMDKAKEYLRHNVAPKQIFGMLAAETLR